MTSVPADALGDDPLEAFARWHDEAAGAMLDPDAAALATATTHGVPSVRFVLLRGITPTGVRFFTGYDSRKGVELASNPRAAVAWFAPSIRRQVRIEGTVAQLDPRDSDAYFAGRARGHQLGAHASGQSTPISSRDELVRAYRDAEERFAGRDVERPARWGGYLLTASLVELWVQRDDRLHDRFAYTRDATGWTAVRLSP